VAPGLLERRYGVPLRPLLVGPGGSAGTAPDAEAWLAAAAARHTSGDGLRMAQRLLDDFRRSLLGPIALELPDR
jgi:ribosome biogenesis GTPase A